METDAFFVIEPGISIYANITNFFRIGFGVTYRYINGVNTSNLTDDDYRGISASLIFAFGVF